MPNIYQDKYILGQSSSGQIQASGDEIRLDLSLKANTNSISGGNISGTVTSGSTPVSGAYIKLMSNTYDPLQHTVTDASGNYSFKNVAAGTYNIFAIATGMSLNQAPVLTVKSYHYYTVNFSLTADPSSQLGIIAGDLTKQGTQEAINGAVISLFLNETGGTQTLKAVTYSNQYGQFVFLEVPKASYTVKITALGYDSLSVDVTINTNGQIQQVVKEMVPTVGGSLKGTVSGIITNASAQPISGANVILYQVNTTTPNNPLTPIAFTKTNANGVYLFAGVANGTYKVKSNEIHTVIVNI
ncbi:MSCRAMM family protein [Clostridium botulinum]|uniref:MSCRAMM family protein n=1 Tax=Clostridium botulinum TaxID=1491 RepID=UPI001E55761F|nr:carboxypeptidase-like regulatory domain-containing protein [Clostridium botulinum]MCD3274934.1 DUF1416 domain-containing protein [Clostridium botulinum C/D]MCD3286900.1 DUF1416 domain-containing protein [Clostridium botulinum C/D]MCD3291435.1 DUF1416 domain-containing protein [Clostridium botulinum C/D]MCD3301718.1 DUF1416 domain-containing protein [Clostridium botulinum C/D]